MVHRLDAFLIRQFEKVSHGLQKAFGIRSGHLAFTLLAISSALFLLMHLIPEFIHHAALVERIFSVIVFLSHAGDAIKIGSKLEKQQTDVMNRAKIVGVTTRVAFAGMCVLCILPDVRSGDLWFELRTLSLYFEACDDLPLSPSKVRQWLSGFGRAFRPALAGARS